MKKNIKKYVSKELSIHNLNSKQDLINRIIQSLNTYLPEDISEVIEFGFDFDSSLMLNNSDFCIDYIGLESEQEYQKRMLLEEKDKEDKLLLEKKNKENKLKLISKLAEELNFDLIERKYTND